MTVAMQQPTHRFQLCLMDTSPCSTAYALLCVQAGAMYTHHHPSIIISQPCNTIRLFEQ